MQSLQRDGAHTANLRRRPRLGNPRNALHRFLLGLTYIYTDNDSSLETETGSLRSQINLERPVKGNSYALAASFAPSSRLVIGGWVGLTKATVIDLGNADVWNYALTLALPDFGIVLSCRIDGYLRDVCDRRSDCLR